ncbi:unnamed protein product [Lepeophtheirus salmonis]|uniref:(salmon louse) hypothetical protein n=4 Tax=Lepeophtheirus salmonis TaxID=72036 RepID=A0A7R8H092_LEPSM|nr:unnamed protein product [Lepeophtheirus salmonis]CAF2765596.1 unnamed protein product [Lepeophtheirus salmonis]
MSSLKEIILLVLCLFWIGTTGLPRKTQVFRRPKMTRLPRFPLPIQSRFLYSGTPISPQLSFHLGNGDFKEVSLKHFDPLHLRMIQLRNGNYSNKMLCHYLGSVESESSVAIGVTGCPGESKVQITLVSRRLTAQYLLNGSSSEIYQVIPSPWKANANREYALNETQITCKEIIVQTIEKSALMASYQCSGMNDCVIPSLHKMTVKIGYDESLEAKETETLEWISGVMTHTQTFLYDPTLPTKIEIDVIGFPKKYHDNEWTAEDSITTVEKYAQGDTETDLYVFLCADSNLYGTVGIAYVGGLCDTNGYQVSINEWRTTEAETAKVVAHEMGHNMGMSHDFDKVHSGNKCTGIMDYGKTPDTWSSCSQDDFKNHYFSITKSGKEHCLEVLSNDSGSVSSHCDIPSFNGDGYCDDENNNEACGFDGGDCCNNDRGDWDTFCHTCKCHESEGGCEHPEFAGDGYCDDGNNNVGCGFDGGDCCSKSNLKWDHFCTECVCHLYKLAVN